MSSSNTPDPAAVPVPVERPGGLWDEARRLCEVAFEAAAGAPFAVFNPIKMADVCCRRDTNTADAAAAARHLMDAQNAAAMFALLYDPGRASARTPLADALRAALAAVRALAPAQTPPESASIPVERGGVRVVCEGCKNLESALDETRDLNERMAAELTSLQLALVGLADEWKRQAQNLTPQRSTAANTLLAGRSACADELRAVMAKK